MPIVDLKEAGPETIILIEPRTTWRGHELRAGEHKAMPVEASISEWNDEMVLFITRDAWGGQAELRLDEKDWKRLEKAVNEQFAELARRRGGGSKRTRCSCGHPDPHHC